jgi:hypothetical protein
VNGDTAASRQRQGSPLVRPANGSNIKLARLPRSRA